MEQFLALVAMSLLAGIILAALAVWLTTTRGNTISDAAGNGRDAINLQLLEKLKLVSGVPIVALYVVSAMCAFALPTYFVYVNRLETHIMLLDGTFDQAATDPPPQQLSVLPDNLHIYGNTFSIPIVVTDAEQQFDVSAGQSYAPLTLQAYVNSATQSVYYTLNGARKYGPFSIVGTAAHVGAIHLTRVPGSIGMK